MKEGCDPSTYRDDGPRTPMDLQEVGAQDSQDTETRHKWGKRSVRKTNGGVPDPNDNQTVSGKRRTWGPECVSRPPKTEALAKGIDSR